MLLSPAVWPMAEATSLGMLLGTEVVALFTVEVSSPAEVRIAVPS